MRWSKAIDSDPTFGRLGTIPSERIMRLRQHKYPGMVSKSSIPNGLLLRCREAKRRPTAMVSRTVKAIATFRRRSPE